MGDPLFPDPLNTVNVSALDTPNARAAQLQAELPLAFFVEPISTTPGRLALHLDLEDKRWAGGVGGTGGWVGGAAGPNNPSQTAADCVLPCFAPALSATDPHAPAIPPPPTPRSMVEADGLCSLRLREPCEWEQTLYAAVTAVEPLPLAAVLSLNETMEAREMVADTIEAANAAAQAAANAFGDGTYSGGWAAGGWLGGVQCSSLVAGHVLLRFCTASPIACPRLVCPPPTLPPSRRRPVCGPNL